MQYFQTNDRFCFLFGIFEIDPYKVLILEKKCVFSKFKYNDKIYSFQCYHDISEIAEYFKNELLKILEKVTQIGGRAEIKNIEDNTNIFDSIKSYNDINYQINKKFYNDEKIENKIENKYINNNIEMSFKSLMKIINSITSSEITYLCYKLSINEYKKLLGDKFDMINELINKLKRFAERIDCPEKLRNLYDAIASFGNYNDIFEFSEKGLYYIILAKRIYNEVPIEFFNKHDYEFEHLIRNANYYKININDSIDNICKYIKARCKYFRKKEEEEQYERETEDTYVYCEEYEKQNGIYQDIWSKHLMGIKVLTEEELLDLRKKRTELELKYPPKLKKDIKKNNGEEQKRGKEKDPIKMCDIIKKYMKYKKKYLKSKNK